MRKHMDTWLICNRTVTAMFGFLSVFLPLLFIYLMVELYLCLFVFFLSLHETAVVRSLLRTHRHTFVPLGIFSVILSNTTLSSCLIATQGHNISLHELPTLGGFVRHTVAHISPPAGPCAQLSVSLILLPSSLLNPLSSPPTSSPSSSSLTSHTFLIFSHPRPLHFFFFFSPSLSLFIINDAWRLHLQVWWIFKNDIISSYGGISIGRPLKIAHVRWCCLVWCGWGK